MKLKYIATLFLLFHFFHLNGQFFKQLENINADSLRSILPQLTGKDQIDALNKITLSMVISDPDNGIQMAKHTISLANNINYQKGVADAYYCIGRSYTYVDSLKNSVKFLLDALRIYESIPLCEEMGHTLAVLSGINLGVGRVNEAILYDKRRLKICLELGNYFYVAGTYLELTKFYYISEFDSAMYYGLKTLEVLRDYPDTLLLIYTYTALQAIELWKGDADPGNHEHNLKSIKWGNEAIDLINEISGDISNYLINIYGVYYNLAEGYLEIEPPNASNLGLSYLYSAKKILDTTQFLLGAETLVYSLLASLKLKEGDYKGAIQLNLEGIKIAEERLATYIKSNFKNIHISPNSIKFDHLLYKMWSYDSLYNIHYKLKDYENALEFYKLKEEASKELFREDHKNLIALLEAEFENEKTEKQIAVLERDKKINELKVVQTRNLNTGIVIVFIIILLLGMLFIRQNKLKNEHKSTLLEQKLLRLQMNPHFIFNALSSIHSLMNPKDVNKASDYLGNFSRLLRSSLESSREDYILLDEEISSMKNYLELQQLRYENKFDFKIDVDSEIDLESSILPPMLLQPFIENAIEHGIKHKEAKGHIRIRFKLENKKLTCEIEDDGVGREKAWEVEYAKKGKHKSMATEIIHDRIKILNKKLKQNINLSIIDKETETNQSIGTLVKLDLPYLID